MKLRFNREEMVEALGTICNVAVSRSPKDVLKCVCIEAQPDVLLLSATDQEVGLRYSVVQVEVDEPGRTLVVADTLGKIVRECDDELLSIETEEAMLHVRGVGSHFQIVTHDPSEFPAMPTMEGEPGFVIGHALLRRLIEWTVFASARESTRYAINGVLWEVEGDALTMAATDGRRLSLGRGKLDSGGLSTVPQVIVPTKASTLFARLPAEPEAAVGVTMAPNRLLLKAGGALVNTSLVEGHFPKYEDVIPTDCDRKMVVGTSVLLSALKRAALLTNEESKGVRLSLAEGELTLSSRAPEQGESTVSIPVHYDSEPMEIGFNPIFLLDVLRVADTEEVTLALKAANRPGVLRLGDDFTHVVMPVNLASA
ncbi:MAG: DNA polymerase III subunit beta [Phycisphaerales bacterium]|nr:MAG: DNA polymerase III subunit beta [Phycisphaerales bacterium]